MTIQGDIKRVQSVNVEFDPRFSATPLGGGVLIEQTLRSLGVMKQLKRHLPSRGAQARYTMAQFAYGAMAALLLGGDGMDLFAPLSDEDLTRRIFGMEALPAPATTYRLLCELAGLEERPFATAYAPAGAGLAALDIFGQERRRAAHRRIVPEVPEAATARCLEPLRRAEAAVTRRCARALPKRMVRMHGWNVMFGDGTDLEVEGSCFDAARMGREGKRIMRWLTLWLGPALAGQELLAGNADEGRSIPALIERAAGLVRQCCGRGRLLALLDAAFCERPVVEALTAKPLDCDFIICANQYRGALERLAAEQPEQVWRDGGADARRGWEASQVCVFTHWFEGWAAPVTIAARRWRQAGELPGAWLHSSFVATNIEPGAMPPALKKHGYAGALWMLYGTKQGRENHYKTPLRCLGLHHPPSGRLGVNQVYYTLATMAANVAMAMRYAVLAEPERGMTLSRLRTWYFGIAGYLVCTGRRLTVRLAGANLDPGRQRLFLIAFEGARRL
jgi:Transposase DDE domain group 1